MGQPYGYPPQPPGYPLAGYGPPQGYGPPPKRSNTGLIVGIVALVALVLAVAGGAAVWLLHTGHPKSEGAGKSTAQTSTTTSQKSDLSHRSTSDLMSLLPDRSVFPPSWQLESEDLDSAATASTPESSSGSGPPSPSDSTLNPACETPITASTLKQLRWLVLRQAKGSNYDFIGVIYAREGDGYDFIAATRSWAQRCPQGEHTGSADPSHAQDVVSVMPGIDTSPDPSITIKYVLRSDDGVSMETTYVSAVRVRGLLVELLAEDNDSGLSPQERDTVMQAALTILRQAP